MSPDLGGDTEAVTDAWLETALDFRRLPAPEPMVRSLAAADALLPGGVVAVLTPLMPLPLLDLLTGRGLLTQSRELADGGVATLIRRPRGQDVPDQPAEGGPAKGEPAQARRKQARQTHGRKKQDADIGSTRT
jgi:hypothetical protein